MKSTRILISLTLLGVGTHAIKAASSSTDNKNPQKWVVDLSTAAKSFTRACLSADELNKETGAVIRKNAWQLGNKKQYLYALAPTQKIIQSAKITKEYITAETIEAKAALHKKIVGDKSTKQYGLKEALEHTSKDSKNKAAEAFAVYSESDVRGFLRELAKQGKGMQRVTQHIRPRNSAVVGEGAYFVKPSSAHVTYERTLPNSRVSVNTELTAKNTRKPLLVYDATERRYRRAQSKDLSVKLASWKPTENYVNTWVPYTEGENKHQDHKIHADYEWTEDGSSWKSETVGDHTHGWILSSQSMTRKEKEAKKAALDKLIKQVTIHTIIDSKGNRVSADVFTDRQGKVVYKHNDTKPTQNNIVAGRNYHWKEQKGQWHPATTYASVVGKKPVLPTTIAAIRNSLEETGNSLNKLLSKPKENAKQIEEVRKGRDSLRGWLDHRIGFLEQLRATVVPSQVHQADASIKALQAERDKLISELNLSPAHAYYVQASIDAVEHNLLETNEELTLDEIYSLAFGDKTVNPRTALTKACAEVVRNVPDSGRIFGYEPTTVTSYYTKQKELEEIREKIAAESDSDKKLSLIDQAGKIEHDRNNFAQKNIDEARDYINALIPTNKLWKDTQKFESKLHDLFYVLAELNATQRTKKASADAVTALNEQLQLARGEVSQKTITSSDTSNNASSSSDNKSGNHNKRKGKGKTTRRSRRSTKK